MNARLKDDGEALTDELKQILRNAGKNFDQKKRRGESPLHIAAEENAREVAALLIEKGAYINAEDNDGWTPLDHAKYTKAHDVARLLE